MFSYVFMKLSIIAILYFVGGEQNIPEDQRTLVFFGTMAIGVVLSLVWCLSTHRRIYGESRTPVENREETGQ